MDSSNRIDNDWDDLFHHVYRKGRIMTLVSALMGIIAASAGWIYYRADPRNIKGVKDLIKNRSPKKKSNGVRKNENLLNYISSSVRRT